MSYSERLGDLSAGQLQASLTRFGLGELVSTEAIPYGLFGQNLYLDSDAGRFVFRGAPHYDWQLPTERYFADLVQRSTNVPVPWPYLLEPATDLFQWPWGFAIMPRQPGMALADPAVYGALTQSQRLSLAAAIGNMLRDLQALTLPAPGAYDLTTGGMRPFAGGRYVDRTIQRARQSAAQAAANGAHRVDDAKWLDGLLNQLAPAPEPDRYCVVHEDFNRNNMTASIEGDAVEITGIFDLMTCHAGDGLADLPRQFAMYLAEEGGEVLASGFVRAYLAGRQPLDEASRQRARLYVIDERLLVWEYCHRHGHDCTSWGVEGSLRRWLGGFLDQWELIINAA